MKLIQLICPFEAINLITFLIYYDQKNSQNFNEMFRIYFWTGIPFRKNLESFTQLGFHFWDDICNFLTNFFLFFFFFCNIDFDDLWQNLIIVLSPCFNYFGVRSIMSLASKSRPLDQEIGMRRFNASLAQTSQSRFSSGKRGPPILSALQKLCKRSEK